MNGNLETCQDAEEAEASALISALNTCSGLQIFPHTVETDCAGVFKTVEDSRPDISRRCHIYRQIELWRREVGSFQMSLVKRDCNRVAHELAKCTSIEGSRGLWYQSVSANVLPDVLNDCSQSANI